MEQVMSYGLHWDGPVAWLVQGRAGTNFNGLKARCPFAPPKGMCNHLIPAAAPIPDRIHWEKFLTLIDDPLTDVMLPLPHPGGENTFFVEDPDQALTLHLFTLSRLSSPIQPVVKPAWGLNMKDMEKELSSTNVQPLVLIQANAKCQELIDTIGQMSTMIPRTVIIVGNAEVVVQAPMKRIHTQMASKPLEEITTLPLENIGAAVLRRYARKEKLFAPIESRQARRERQINERTSK